MDLFIPRANALIWFAVPAAIAVATGATYAIELSYSKINSAFADQKKMEELKNEMVSMREECEREKENRSSARVSDAMAAAHELSQIVNGIGNKTFNDRDISCNQFNEKNKLPKESFVFSHAVEPIKVLCQNFRELAKCLEDIHKFAKRRNINTSGRYSKRSSRYNTLVETFREINAVSR